MGKKRKTTPKGEAKKAQKKAQRDLEKRRHSDDSEEREEAKEVVVHESVFDWACAIGEHRS